jgi:hypothetical protein
VTIRVPGNWGVPEGALYEEITEPGDVVFEWPDAPPGSKVTYDLAQAPADSTATATLSGAIDGADLPGAYVLERTCTHMGHAVRKDVAVAFLNMGAGAEAIGLTAPVPLSLSVGSTAGTLVIPEATGGTAPYAYTAVVAFDSPLTGGAVVSSVSGRTVGLTGLTNGAYYEVLCTAVDAEGNSASRRGSVLVASVAAGTMLPGAFPASQRLASTATTSTITFNAVGGGFTEPVSYTATIISGPGEVTGVVGQTVSIEGHSEDTTTLVRLRATDSTAPTPLTADAFAIVEIAPSFENPLVWRPLRDISFDSAANAQGPFVLGSQTVPLIDSASGDVIDCTLVHAMNSGSFANITSELTEDNGWRMSWASTATSTNCKGPLKIPLPATIGNDDDLRVTVWYTVSQPVTNNSAYIQVNNDKGGSPPNDDDADVWGGSRVLRAGVATTAFYLKYSAGNGPAALNTGTTPAFPLTGLDGTTEITQVHYLPRYAYRARMGVSGEGIAISADLGAPSTAPSNKALRGGWCAGDSSVWLFQGGSNGGANGGGNQWTQIRRVLIERRTLP